MNLADIIGIAIIAALIVWGARKGFVNSVFSLGSFIISLALALILSPVVSDGLENSFVGDYVRENVYNILAEETVVDAKSEEIGSSLPLPNVLKKNIVDTTEQTVLTVQETIASGVVNIALSLLSVLIVFVLVKVLVWLLSHFFNLVSRLPVIRTANKLFGGVFGAVYGILIVYVILALLTFGATVKAFHKPTELVLESKFVSVMYHQNILLNFLK